MGFTSLYLLAADVVLFSHLLFVAFVVLGLLLVYIGKFLGWGWVHNMRFRVLHLIGITVVVIQSWFGLVCPLTILENWLRRRAGQVVYDGTFISHWMQTLLYYDFPQWLFAMIYTVFGALVLGSWYVVRPRSLTRNKH